MNISSTANKSANVLKGWRVATLGECTAWMSGGTPSKSEQSYWDGEIPWISAKSMKSFYLYDSDDHVTDLGALNGTRIVDPGTILLLVRGMTLHNDVPVGIAMRPMAFNQDVKAIRGVGDTETRFIAYWLLANKHRLLAAVDQASHGTGRLRTEVVQGMDLRLPAPSQQQRIVGVLTALDDKIDQNRRTNRLLERLARAIFQAWFVDFEPVRARAAGERSFPGMPQAVFRATPSCFVDSEIGPIPEGWASGAVSDTADLSRAQLNPQDYPNEVFDHFSIPAFDDGRNAAVEEGRAIKSNKFLVVANCLLASKLNPRIPRDWLPPSAAERRQIASTEFLVVVPREGWDRDYLYCQLQQPEFRDSLAQGASGTSNSHQRVRPQDFLAKSIVLPPEPLRRAFRAVAGPLMGLCESTHGESQKLAELRDLLLPKLLSGEIRPTDFERAVERRL
jgi:type I restriction enzyme S subunit